METKSDVLVLCPSFTRVGQVSEVTYRYGQGAVSGIDRRKNRSPMKGPYRIGVLSGLGR